MQFHHQGYVSTDPRILPASSIGENWTDDLPDEMDVLIVGTGPTGMITAAQLAQYPDVHTRIIDRRPERLELGHADGVQARSMETFQAFGFANRLSEEGYHITEMSVWKPDPQNPQNIIRTARPEDDPRGISEFPHLTISQARILDFFAESMAHSPTRMAPNYGVEFLGLEVAGEGEYPVSIRVRHTAGEREGQERTIRAKYVLGADGARSNVRSAIGRKLEGKQANHAWGVMDILARTDFPDIRLRSIIQSSSGGSILIIPREGGHLFRMYVDLGEVTAEQSREVRKTTLDEIIVKANNILHPYSVEVRHVVWNSVYEVGHRLTDKFDDVAVGVTGQTPRVFIAGDACHTHSAKAAQGMNVSMADGFNLGWKLGHVLSGRSPESLLDTYSTERQVVAQNLINFDREWSTLMAKRPEDFENSAELEDFAIRNAEFPAGFMTHYDPSMITALPKHQDLATGFPIGKRFKSAHVARVCDGNPLHLGHQATADGRWRIYVFADRPAAGQPSKLTDLSTWLAESPDSPILQYTPADADLDAVFDLNVVYQQPHTEFNITDAPDIFRPEVGPYKVLDNENVYSVLAGEDIFDERQIDRNGAIVVVRPDQYVSHVLPLDDAGGLVAFFAQNMLPLKNSRAGQHPSPERPALMVAS
ncbi:FAD-dependent monooxygenase [Arthrobacter sulfonylureivorans]|uniref:FAD-dependent monooxygenase n=1 Tax=Arthrobacter sulfonylureivorans TaxID=2486855 RepID=A0ABY3WD86_9MICC|nr:FAD-dependent monooxygenase [Arthrobacter sulfonylureivorans]UNK45679.1 FAD-dependent monooxygenase [Arthrobacter sulfonylureivorans]